MVSVFLDVVLESWVLEHLSVVFNGVDLLSGNSLGHVCWVLVHVKLNTWVLEDSIVVLGTGVLEGIVEELDSWLLGPEIRLLGNDDSWVGGGVVGNNDSLVSGLGLDNVSNGFKGRWWCNS